MTATPMHNGPFHRILSDLVGRGLLARFHYLEKVASTQHWARESHSKAGTANLQTAGDEPETRLPPSAKPEIYIADLQTRGVGRRGARWLSDASQLAFTLVIEDSSRDQAAHDHSAFPCASRKGLVPLAVATTIARAIESFDSDNGRPKQIGLKWPNDVLLRDRSADSYGKVAGILIESSVTSRSANWYVGIGINTGRNDPIDDAAAAKTQVPTATFDRASLRFDQEQRSRFLGDLITRLCEPNLFTSKSLVDSLPEFRRRCILAGKNITVGGDQSVAMRCIGVADDGGLEVADADGRLKTLYSGIVQTIRRQT